MKESIVTSLQRPASRSVACRFIAAVAGMLESLRADVVQKLPAIDEAKQEAFLTARKRFRTLAAPGQDANAEAQREHEKATTAAEEEALAVARAILPEVDGFLSSDAIDGLLMRIAILAAVGPAGLEDLPHQGLVSQQPLDERHLLRGIRLADDGSITVPTAGVSALTGEVATVATKQQMLVRLNREEPTAFDLPHTKGAWMETAPLKLKLPAGRGTISVTARAPNRGVSIRQWQLKPVK